jgi:integrase
MVIVQDVPGFVARLRGAALYVPAMLALFTGKRRGEVLALRWSRVDLDGKTISVREALESTTAHGLRFKAPKSKAGRRDTKLPEIVVDALREHRKRQLELRMQLGAGRSPDDALLFSNLEGDPLQPSNVSSDWGELAERIGVPEVTFHGLRHTHASSSSPAASTSSPSPSAWGTPSRALPLRSTLTCLQQTTARPRRPSTRPWGLREGVGWQSGGRGHICSIGDLC